MTQKISGEMTAWAVGQYGFESLEHYIEQDMPISALGQLQFTHGDQDMAKHGWIKVGSADITFKPANRVEIVTSIVASLEEEIQRTRAESEKKCTKLNGRIQSLLAITNEVVEL
jgi:FixJ family two-component response regulator